MSKLKEQLINYFGSQKEMAKALGVSDAAVSQWKSIPQKHWYPLEQLTKGEFKYAQFAKIDWRKK